MQIKFTYSRGSIVVSVRRASSESEWGKRLGKEIHQISYVGN